MTDYFALFGEARRPWLDPEKLKEKYFQRSRAAPPDAQINEAFRVLSDPKLRLHHLLILEGVNLTAGRPVPQRLADLSWETGTLLREIDGWLQKNAEATSTLARALLAPERATLERQLQALEEKLNSGYEAVLARVAGVNWDLSLPNDLSKLVELYDSISYRTRLREQQAEKRFQLSVA